MSPCVRFLPSHQHLMIFNSLPPYLQMQKQNLTALLDFVFPSRLALLCMKILSKRAVHSHFNPPYSDSIPLLWGTNSIPGHYEHSLKPTDISQSLYSFTSQHIWPPGSIFFSSFKHSLSLVSLELCFASTLITVQILVHLSSTFP